jgi:hypothetical protein
MAVGELLLGWWSLESSNESYNCSISLFALDLAMTI